MATEAQINANRANSQKSTGPRTEAGKAVSRFNNLQTGIHAESEVIRGEDPNTLAALAADFHQQYQPATPSEAALVDSIAHHVWLQRRLRRVEALLWEGERKRMTLRISTIPLDDGEVFAGHVGAFSRIQRRIDSTERNLHRAFDLLRRQQSCRAANEALQPAVQDLQPETLQPQAPQPEPEIGFVPSIHAVPPQTSPGAPPNSPKTRQEGDPSPVSNLLTRPKSKS
jgi:hypothetical protein